MFAGVEKKFPGGGYLNGLAGWRSETATSDRLHEHRRADVPRPDQRQLARSGGRWSLEADWKHKDFDGEDYAYYEIRSGLSLHRSPRWVLTALYERTTDPAVVVRRGKGGFPGRSDRAPARRRTLPASFRGLDQGIDEMRRRRLPALPAVRRDTPGGVPEVLIPRDTS